jgi:MFS family permease
LSRDFWTFFTVALCYDFGVAMFLFLYNLYLLDIGFNERQVGFIGGAMTLGIVVGTMPMGMLVQRVGLRRVLVCGFVATAAVSALRTMVVGEQALIGLAFAGGLCLCFWAVSFSPVAAALTTEQNRTFAFSLLFSVGIATGGLGGLAGGWLPGRLIAMHGVAGPAAAKRIALLTCCVVVALGAWPASRLRLQDDRERGNRVWTFDPFLRRFLPAIALWSLAAGAFVPFAAVYLARQVRVPLAQIGVIFSASQLAQVAAILLAPVVFKRCGLVAGIAYTQVATAIALVGLARAHGLGMVVVLYLSFTAFHWMGGPGIYSLLMNRVAEDARSSASAATSLVTNVCQAIATAVVGAAYVAFGYPVVLTAIAGVAAVAAVAFWALLREPATTGADAAAIAQIEC